MRGLRERLIDGWDGVLGVSMFFGALLMLLQWRRQRRRLKQLLKLDESGWEQPDA